MEILNLSLRNSLKTIKKAVGIIRKSGVIVYPTDTVYGLICDATDKKAVKKLFKIKKRSFKKAVSIFVKDIKMAKKLAVINKKQEKLFKKYWPGKITVVLNRKGIRKLYGVDKKTIAIRIPKYKFINNLQKKLNFPLTGTSANVSGKPASTKIKEILKQFQNERSQPDLIVSAGNLKPAKPSTIIDLTGPKPKILRK